MSANATPTVTGRSHPTAAPVVELDVRDDLRMGREPFSRIMAAVAGMSDDAVLLLRATFEPAPLFGVLGKRGFVHESVAHAPDDWSVWFWRPDESARAVRADRRAPAAPPPEGPPGGVEGEAAVRLDVRGLQPPEPLMRTLTALETLSPGQVLLQLNDRVPELLLPMLAERGFSFEVDASRPGTVQVRIWRAR